MELITKMVLDSWYTTVANTDKLLAKLTDQQLMGDVAEGRNSGIYLLGHLIVVHDRMLPLLGFEEQHFPRYNNAFLTSPDKTGQEMPALAELRAQWTETNDRLDKHFKAMQPADWLAKHTAVSDEDFAREPHRNRMNVLLSRTTHLAGHLGQMQFLNK